MKQSVRLRLMGGFGLLVLLMIIMQGIGYRSIQTLSESSKNLIDKDVVKLVSVEEYEKHIIQQVMYMRDYLTSGTESNVNKYNFSVAAAPLPDFRISQGILRVLLV